MLSREWSIDKLLSNTDAFDWIVLNKTGWDALGPSLRRTYQSRRKKWTTLYTYLWLPYVKGFCGNQQCYDFLVMQPPVGKFEIALY